MKTLVSIAAIVLLGAGSAANAQINMPNPNVPGGSYQTAIRLIATNDLMLDRQIKSWLHRHYPDWDTEPHEMIDLGGERYAVVYISSKDNPGRRVYFRVAGSQRDQNEDSDTSPF